MPRSFCSVAESSLVLMVLHSKLSSAKSLMCVPLEMLESMSLMYARNRRGPRTVPWGTPERTGAGEDAAPSTRTVWVLFDKKERIHRWRGSPMPSAVSF